MSATIYGVRVSVFLAMVALACLQPSVAGAQCRARFAEPPWAKGWLDTATTTATVMFEGDGCGGEPVQVEIRVVFDEQGNGLDPDADAASVLARLTDSNSSLLALETDVVVSGNLSLALLAPFISLDLSLQLGIVLRDGQGQVLNSPTVGDLWIVWMENGFTGPEIEVVSQSTAAIDDQLTLIGAASLLPVANFNPWTTIAYQFQLALSGHEATDLRSDGTLEYGSDLPFEISLVEQDLAFAAGDLILEVSRADRPLPMGEFASSQVSLGAICVSPNQVLAATFEADQETGAIIWGEVTGVDGYVVWVTRNVGIPDAATVKLLRTGSSSTSVDLAVLFGAGNVFGADYWCVSEVCDALVAIRDSAGSQGNRPPYFGLSA